MLRKNIIDWARSCHFDILIAVKDIKRKRWMIVLSYLEIRYDFDIDDYNGVEKSWPVILEAINRLSDDEIVKLDVKRKSL